MLLALHGYCTAAMKHKDQTFLSAENHLSHQVSAIIQ